MKNSACTTCFVIESAGTYDEHIGFVAAPGSNFDPADVTRMLREKPFRERRMGAERRNGHGLYPYSRWYGFKQEKPALDAESQCLNIVKKLRPYAEQLIDFRSEHNVELLLLVTPTVAGDAPPILHFSREIIDFCAAVGAEIGIDLQVEGK